jgi:hypothetical protein
LTAYSIDQALFQKHVRGNIYFVRWDCEGLNVLEFDMQFFT